MKKITSILLISILCFTGIGQINIEKPGYLIWDANLSLDKDCFLGTIPEGDTMKAETFTLTDSYLVEYDERKLVYHIVCYFSKEKSWVNPKESSLKGLISHERLHFDIAELHTRIIRKKLSQYIDRDPSLSEFKEFINSTFKNVMNDKKEMQEKYDLETLHGLLFQKQVEWNNKIKSELLKYDDYSDTKVVIRRKLPSEYLKVGN